MKKLSTYLFLVFFSFQTPSWADDIRDFQIEGMSVGDSLLDFISKDKIENEFEIVIYKKPEKNKYKRIYIENVTFENFDYISIDVKYNDSKYIIHGVTGMDDDSDLKKCFKKQNEIIKDLSSIFTQKPDKYILLDKDDETGQSKRHYAVYYLDGGDVSIICYEFAKHMNIRNGLDLSIRSKEFQNWLSKN